MIELDLVSIGIWSPLFPDWPSFVHGINKNEWQESGALKPELIPPRERRRAPQSVKLAVEVLDQACTNAGMNPSDAAVVFSSGLGDMDITDYMCRILNSSPRLVSPTKFHNSVHNATTGYWSIASHSHAPTNAISAHGYTAPMAFLEAACQAAEDDMPVLLVTQEMAAPDALRVTCPAEAPFSMATLLSPPGACDKILARLSFSVTPGSATPPALAGDLAKLLSSNFGAVMLPMAAAIAAEDFSKTSQPVNFEFPLSEASCLSVVLTPYPSRS
jgi:hypothetical protein